MVCFPFVGDRVGGSHISALKLIEAMDRTRFKPLVAVHDPEGPAARLFADHGIAFEAAPAVARHARAGWRAIGNTLALAGPLASFLRRRRVDIVHTNDGYSHAVWALPAQLAGARLVWHHRAGPDALGLRLLAPLAAHSVISVSRFAAPRPGLWSAARKCSVIPSPFDAADPEVDRAAAHAVACAELGIDPRTRLIGFFGNLVPRKRPVAFVDAIAALLQQAPGLPVLGLLFGHPFRGLDETVTRRARELGVSSSLRLMGFRYPPEPWLAACDVMLVPGVDEPFGRTLIEAMLLGTPVVATHSGGNPEALEDGRTGFLVPVGVPDAMARQALRLLQAPDLHAKIAEAARADARRRFGVTTHVEAIMAVYDRLLGKGGQPR
jgi:glycosyltransferase involved in cell wall biosynthesis